MLKGKRFNNNFPYTNTMLYKITRTINKRKVLLAIDHLTTCFSFHLNYEKRNKIYKNFTVKAFRCEIVEIYNNIIKNYKRGNDIRKKEFK